MTTFAELRTRAARALSDPAYKTFTAVEIGDYINRGIVEVSRHAPQQFTEDVTLFEGQLTYPLRGGTGNLVANPSFEQGDQTMFDSAYNVLTPSTAPDLTAGWETAYSDIRVLFAKSALAKTGTCVGVIYIPANTASRYIYQNIPVNPDTTYVVSGWHWKGTAGGEGNIIQVHTLDAGLVNILSDVIRHDTTASLPTYMSGSYTTPADGTVKFLQVRLYAYSAGATNSQQSYGFENISVMEASDANLVAANSRELIEVKRVEVFTNDQTVNRSVEIIPPATAEMTVASEAGWEYWNSNLSIPYSVFAHLDTATRYLKVWGWAPYDRLVYDSQMTDLTGELEEAVIVYCRLEGLTALGMSRDLFSQWQTRSGNTDVSPASLMNAQSVAAEEWRRKMRSVQVLRGY